MQIICTYKIISPDPSAVTVCIFYAPIVGLACRSLDPTKIIITSKNRLRLSCLGVMDVVLNENSASVNPLALVQHYQQEDLTALGKLVLALACKSTVAVQRENITTAVDIISRSYTTDLRNLIMLVRRQTITQNEILLVILGICCPHNRGRASPT